MKIKALGTGLHSNASIMSNTHRTSKWIRGTWHTQVFSSHCPPHNGIYILIWYKLLINARYLLFGKDVYNYKYIQLRSRLRLSELEKKVIWKGWYRKGLFFPQQSQWMNHPWLKCIVILFWCHIFRKAVKFLPHFLLF